MAPIQQDDIYVGNVFFFIQYFDCFTNDKLFTELVSVSLRIPIVKNLQQYKAFCNLGYHLQRGRVPICPSHDKIHFIVGMLDEIS